MKNHETSPEENNGLMDYGVDYSRIMTPHVVGNCMQLGLDPGFVDYFERSLSELHFVRVPSEGRDKASVLRNIGDSQTHTAIETPTLSYQSITNAGDGNTKVSANDPPKVHAILVTLEDVGLRRVKLEKAFRKVKVKIPADEKLLQQAAIDWIFYEIACKVLGNTCYMTQNFPNFSADFDGQNPYYHADRSLSAAYLRRKTVVDRPELKSTTIAEDTKNLQEGFGLMMLHSNLLFKGLVKNTTKANWLITELRRSYPSAHRSEDIEARLSAIKPRKDVRSHMAELSIAFFDPSLEPEFEAEEREKSEKTD